MEYSGKRVLITGGAGQAGRAIAEAYARLGAAVILADKDYGVERFVTERLRPLSPGSRFIHCDLALTSACGKGTSRCWSTAPALRHRCR